MMNRVTIRFWTPFIVIAIGGLLALQVPLSPFLGQKEETIKVLSYNIHHGSPPGTPGIIAIDKIAKVITESGADLVALQEVDLNTERSGRTLHQMEKLAELTGMNWHFHKSIDFQGGAYGNGILSTLPILEKGGFPLPYQDGTEPRGVAYVKVALGTGDKLYFSSTHLDFTNEANTLMQAKHLNEYFEDIKDPLIVAGDFNSEPGSSPIRYFESYFISSCKTICPPTFPQTEPQKTIDYIFLKKDTPLSAIKHTVIKERYASDHLPIMATIEIGG